jgi:hypothetical protein
MSADLIARAAWHERTFGVEPREAMDRAERELDLAEYWTPWELRDSEYVIDRLMEYAHRNFVTVQ